MKDKDNKKKKNKRSFGERLISFVITIAILGGLCYLGYDYIVKHDIDIPGFIDFFKKEQYDITFVDESGNVVYKTTTGDKYTIPDAPAKEGYRFDHWQGDLENITENTIVTPVYVKTWKVTLFAKSEADGEYAQLGEVLNVDDGDFFTYDGDIPTPEGYRSDDWDYHNAVVEDIDVHAKYIKVWTVTFVDDEGETFATATIDNGSKFSGQTAPAKEGYRFSHWDYDQPIESDRTVQAVYVKIWTVSFSDGEKIYATQVVDNGENADTPETPTKAEDIRATYTFEDWDASFWNVTADITVTAQYTAKLKVYECGVIKLNYNEDLQGWSVAGISDSATAKQRLVIPFEFKKLPVTAINADCFGGIGLKSIYVPSSVTEATTLGVEGEGAFEKVYTDSDNLAALKLLLPALADKIEVDYVDDKVFLISAPSSVVSDTQSFAEYLDWGLFNRLEEFDMTVTDGYTPDEAELQAAYALLTCGFSGNVSLKGVGNTITITPTYNAEAEQRASEDDKQIQKTFATHYTTSPRAADYEGFAVNEITESYSVSTSEQLVYVLEHGVRPEPVSGSVAERQYSEIKRVLRDIVSDDMDDFQKAHAIYDWLIDNVVYDSALLTITESAAPNANLNIYNGFHLEGVFDDGRAVCEGIAKAFASMCRVEGIKAIIASGKAPGNPNGVGHAWNKVYINGEWYEVDATQGGVLSDTSDDGVNVADTEFMNHGKLFYTQAEMDVSYVETTMRDGTHADGVYNIYEHLNFVYGEVEYDMVIESQAELNILGAYLSSFGYETIDIMVTFDYGEEINDELGSAGIYKSFFKPDAKGIMTIVLK